MKKNRWWGMVGISVGVAGLMAGCSTCPTCENGVAPVRERTWSMAPAGVAPTPVGERSYNLGYRGWERAWPYGPNIATPSLW